MDASHGFAVVSRFCATQGTNQGHRTNGQPGWRRELYHVESMPQTFVLTLGCPVRPRADAMISSVFRLALLRSIRGRDEVPWRVLGLPGPGVVHLLNSKQPLGCRLGPLRLV